MYTYVLLTMAPRNINDCFLAYFSIQAELLGGFTLLKLWSPRDQMSSLVLPRYGPSYIFYRAYEGSAWPMLLTRAFFRAFRESFFFSTRKFPYEYALSDTWTHEIDPSVRSGYADHLPSHRGRRPMTVQRQGLEDGIHTYVCDVWKNTAIYSFFFHFLSFTFVCYNSRACTYQVALINNIIAFFALPAIRVVDLFCFELMMRFVSSQFIFLTSSLLLLYISSFRFFFVLVLFCFFSPR